jgi:ribosomal 50S subunit-recycling heat shock protein
MTRLDLFLKNTGLVKQRSEAKRACDAGRVRIDGNVAKASQSVSIGMRIDLELEHIMLEFEVLSVPQRPAPRADRGSHYCVISQERRDPSRDLEF